MKKFLIISTFIVFIFCAIPNKIFAEETWDSLTKEQRKNYINECLEQITASNNSEISDDTLTKIFGKNYERDRDFRLHKSGKNLPPGILAMNIYQKYYTGGSTLIGHNTNPIDINTGYGLVKDNVTLVYNHTGVLMGIHIKQGAISREYSRSKKLLNTKYYDNRYNLIINVNPNGNISSILWNNRPINKTKDFL